jgi:hypothetical protein
VSFDVSRVPVEQLAAVWPQIRPMVRRGLARGSGDSTSEAEILRRLENGEAELWAVHDGPKIIAVLAVEILQRERGKALFVLLIAGREFHAWSAQVQRLLCDYRDLIGAYTIEASVRPGLTKWLGALGWKPKATVMEFRAQAGQSPVAPTKNALKQRSGSAQKEFSDGR